MTKEQLVYLRNTSQFKCPQCDSPLRLKIGKIVIPHFAHIVLTDCLSSFSERESPTHLIGKQQLAEFFTRVGCIVSVEAYLPKISQRPDLLVKKNKRSFAIEFQCSVIPIVDIEKRNLGYSKVNTRSIWMLRTPLNIYKDSKGITYIKLSRFMQYFITNETTTATLITYNPSTSEFIYISHLMHLNDTAFVAKISALSIEQQTFPFAQVKTLTTAERAEYWNMFKYKRSRSLHNRIMSGKFGAMDKFLKNCYEQRIVPEDMPLFVGFPIKGSEVIQNNLIEWQLALLISFKEKHMDFNCITNEWIESFIILHCKVADTDKAKTVISHYCRLLQFINYKIDVPISQQQISESILINYFNGEKLQIDVIVERI
ncbi:competence protein CoiA family protein [Paenisporosarcina sp. TG20]|uniref:competence protein CoiA n=1 Tax=Paenisporosarcina sp. TG20 TaxID=1211706 RepID=UPI0003180BB3